MYNIQTTKHDTELEAYKEEHPEDVSVWYAETLLKSFFMKNPIIAKYARVGEGRTDEAKVEFKMLDGTYTPYVYTFKDLVGKAIQGSEDYIEWASPKNVKWGNKQWVRGGGIEVALIRKTIMVWGEVVGQYEARKIKK